MHRPRLPIACLVLTACAPAGVRSPSAGGAATQALILQAEHRGDAADPALVAGLASPDSATRLLARRARWRIADSTFAVRDSLPVPAASPAWTEPSWKLRYRALAGARDDCAAMRTALADEVWIVRLRAADVLRPSCAGDEQVARVLAAWIDAPPAANRSRGGVTWHGSAHAVLALARMKHPAAAARVSAAARHPSPWVRLYAARAAGLLDDRATLALLAADADPNAREAAIEGFARVSPVGGEALLITGLDAEAPQVVRAAATALKGRADPRIAPAAHAALARLDRRAIDPERDARIALRELLGMPGAEPRRPGDPIPARFLAAALATRPVLRVSLAPASGGGSFDVRLRSDVAPITTARILELVDQRYYDNTTWHRTEHDFVVQGGGHGASEYVGASRFFRDELGRLSHLRGTVGMSTRGHDTGDGQWFVNLRDNARLDRAYTVFGEVVDGMAVVDDLMEGDVIASIRVVTTP